MFKIRILKATLLIVIFNTTMFAQENNEPKTLLGKTKPLNFDGVGYFVAPKIGFTQMDGDLATLLNVRAGINFRDKFSLGTYFATSINQINPNSENIPNIYMDYWTFGGFAEYTFISKKAFHLTVPLYVGFGEVQMDNELGAANLGEANFFQIEPVAMLEVNIHKNFRLNMGAGYRFVENMNYRNFNHTDISGFTAYLGLKIGLFK